MHGDTFNSAVKLDQDPVVTTSRSGAAGVDPPLTTPRFFDGIFWLKRAEHATAPGKKPHPTVMGPLGYRRDDHLPSGQWCFYEYPDRKPKLPEQVKSAYVPDYEQ